MHREQTSVHLSHTQGYHWGSQLSAHQWGGGEGGKGRRGMRLASTITSSLPTGTYPPVLTLLYSPPITILTLTPDLHPPSPSPHSPTLSPSTLVTHLLPCRYVQKCPAALFHSPVQPLPYQSPLGPGWCPPASCADPEQSAQKPAPLTVVHPDTPTDTHTHTVWYCVG